VGAGGTFQLRFAETDNQLFLNMGVDNAGIDYAPATILPEPTSLSLGFLGLAGFAVRRFLKRPTRQAEE
jgi:hypothetical protein